MARPDFRNQLILAIVLFLLGTFAYWHEYRRKPEQEKAALDAKKILALRGMTVAAVEVEREATLYKFSCDDLKSNPPLCRVGDPSHWRLETPMKTRADDTNVNNLLMSVSNWEPSDTVDLSKETEAKKKQYLRDYGLDSSVKPAFGKLRLTDEHGMVHELYLGAKHPVNDAYFVIRNENGKRDEDHILLLPSLSWAGTDRNVTFWRDKKVLSLNQPDVTEVEVTSVANQNIPVTVMKDPVEGWKVTAHGETLPGDPDAIGALTSSILYLAAKGFAFESKDAAGAKPLLDSAKRTITIRLKSSGGKDQSGKDLPLKESTVEIYEKKFRDGAKTASTAYATVLGNDPIYEIETTELDRLTKSFDELRLTRLVPAMDRFSLSTIEITREKATVKLEQEKGKWTSGGKEFDPARLNGLLDLLSQKTFGSGEKPRKDVPVVPADALTLRMGPKWTDVRFDFAFWREKDKTWVLDRRHTQMPAFEVLPMVSAKLPWEVAEITKPKPIVPSAEEKKAGILMDATGAAGKAKPE